MKSNQKLVHTQDSIKYFLVKNLKQDIPASIVVFLVALPLCLGIALASGAPLFSGILTGIVGGIVVSLFSGSQLSVSGPAAGLTVIVLGAITGLGNYETFLLAVVLAGVLQILLGIIRAGTIGAYFPSAVIEGMLAAIGIILILKQLPHIVGYDLNFEGSERYVETSGENTFSAIAVAFNQVNYGAVIITVFSLSILILWPKVKKLSFMPAPLLVVLIGILLGLIFQNSSLSLGPDHLVQVPVVSSWKGFSSLFTLPDFASIQNPKVWTVAVTFAVVASLETLLSIEAVDKIDPIKRVTPTNRELIAQGAGNVVSGLLGGLPMTSVIVRSSVNVNSGGRTKMSAILHGFWLLLSFLLIPSCINLIPLASLGAILLLTGYKLTRLQLFQQMWKSGKDQFIPFIVTVLAVVFTDLLKGVGIGMLIGIFYILRTNLRNPYFYRLEQNGDKKVIHMKLAEQVTFLNKAAIQYALIRLSPDTKIIIDGTDSRFIDHDVLEVIHNFQENAYTKGIEVELLNIKRLYHIPQINEPIY